MYLNTHRDKILKVLLSASGIISIAFSLYLSVSFYFSDFQHKIFENTYKIYFLILSAEYIAITLLTGLNKSFMKRGLYGEAIVVFNYCSLMVCGLILLLFWLHRLGDSHRLILGLYVVLFCTIDYLSRLTIKTFLQKIYFNSKFSNKLLVISDNQNIRQVLTQFNEYHEWSRQICGICVLDEREENVDCSAKVVADKHTLLKYITSNNVDEVFVYSNLIYSDSEIKNTISQIEEMGIKVNIRINLDLFDFLPKSYTKIDRLASYYCVSISRNYISYRKRFLKHLLDYAGGLTGFVIFLISFLILAPIIKLDSKGPILFSQNRVGRNGRIFKCYKFRSMRVDAEELKHKLLEQNEMNGLMFKMENDPRVTRIGRFIRKTSLDELPQFINVLKGDMSLVGTRPPTVEEYSQYEPKHKARVSMMPGLTGLWQVSGRSDIKDFDEVVKLDMDYIDNASFWLDVKIILLTIKCVIFGKGAK